MASVRDLIDGYASTKVNFRMAPSDDRLRKALRRYRSGVFTDADVTRCIGLSERSIRELIKRGAVRTLSEDRGAGRIRTFDATTFKRLAFLAAINEAGFSLNLAGRMAYLLPSDDHLYRTYDPINVLFDTTVIVEGGELPPRLESPKFHWFDPDKPATADPDNDCLLEIYDGRFVALVFQRKRGTLIYGDLRKGGTDFVSWWPFQAQLQLTDLSSTGADVAPKWEGRRSSADRIDPRFLNYRYENHDDDALRHMACAAAQRPIFTMTINITLAIRLALRRYLGIEPLARTSLASPTVSARGCVTAEASVQVHGTKYENTDENI